MPRLRMLLCHTAYRRRREMVVLTAVPAVSNQTAQSDNNYHVHRPTKTGSTAVTQASKATPGTRLATDRGDPREQKRLRALAHANEVRHARATLKRQIATRELSAAEVLLRPPPRRSAGPCGPVNQTTPMGASGVPKIPCPPPGRGAQAGRCPHPAPATPARRSAHAARRLSPHGLLAVGTAGAQRRSSPRVGGSRSGRSLGDV